MKIIKVNGKDYVRMGDKLVPVDESGQPIGVWSKETPNAAGGQDCTVHVPCLQIAPEVHKPS